MTHWVGQHDRQEDTMSEEWSKERLRKVVEERWQGGVCQTWETDRPRNPCGEARRGGASIPFSQEQEVNVVAPTVEEVRAMLAAAVLAPELWALVDAVREFYEARLLYNEGPQPSEAAISRSMVAEVNMYIALALLESPGEGKEQEND